VDIHRTLRLLRLRTLKFLVWTGLWAFSMDFEGKQTKSLTWYPGAKNILIQRYDDQQGSQAAEASHERIPLELRVSSKFQTPRL
jgi:hypothetical protein